jgi:hypothetical protein
MRSPSSSKEIFMIVYIWDRPSEDVPGGALNSSLTLATGSKVNSK